MRQHLTNSFGRVHVLLGPQFAFVRISDATHVGQGIQRVDVTHDRNEISIHPLPRDVTQET